MVELAKPLERRAQNAVKVREAAVRFAHAHIRDNKWAFGIIVKAFLTGVAAEREAWQKEYDKKFAEWTAAINRLNELAGEHRVTLAALDAAEEIIDHVQTRYEGQVVRGNMLEKMREHQFQRADKAEARVKELEAGVTDLKNALSNAIDKSLPKEARQKK